jgi:superfamily II DNA/RNA helicase
MKLTYEEEKQKPELIVALMRKFAIHSGNTIIFVERKVDASNLSRKLDQAGIRNRALHGDVQQRQRE